MSGLLLRLYHRLPASARTLAATAEGLYLRWWRYGPMTERLAQEARERERWSAARWTAWREERLAFVLDRAATRVPYYREQWAARRRRGDRASRELLQNWPILEKEAVRRSPRAFVADDCSVRRMFRSHTSGTTGTPLVLWRSRLTVQTLYAIGLARTRGWHGVTLEDRRAMLGGGLVTPVQRRRPPYWVWNASMRQLYMSTHHLAPDLIPNYLDALARYRIRYLVGYASSLHALAQEALRLGRRDLKVVVALTNGEPLSPHARATIGEAFQCPVRETYGMGEAVAGATECEAGRLHQWPEAGLIEVFDEQGPVRHGAFGDFICTGLLNPDMPLIRYRLGDAGRLAVNGHLCACRRTLPLIESIDGRTNDSLLTRDGRRVFWLNPIFYGIPVRQAQIVQETVDRIRVRFTPSPGYSVESGRTVIDRLRDRMGHVDVVLEQVREIPRTARGKIRNVICNLPPTEQEALIKASRMESRVG